MFVEDKDKLTKIPEEIFELKHLQELNLEYNRISELPESIGKLTSLIGIDLSENHLISLPESILQKSPND